MGVKEFKFFKGITIQTDGIQAIIRTLRARWTLELNEDLADYDTIDAERELTNILSNELARAVDEEINNRVTREMNGGENLEYLNRWINIGENNNRA